MSAEKDVHTAARLDAIREPILDALRRLAVERREDPDDGVDEFNDDEYASILAAVDALETSPRDPGYLCPRCGERVPEPVALCNACAEVVESSLLQTEAE